MPRPKLDFPQAIQDAIIVTSRLGLNYLYADACFVEQGNPEKLLKQLQ